MSIAAREPPIAALISRIAAGLRPSAREIVALAKRETDPKEFASFEPLALGLVGSLLALCGVAVFAIVSLPYRLFVRRRRE